jgi:hypothetical protein
LLISSASALGGSVVWVGGQCSGGKAMNLNGIKNKSKNKIKIYAWIKDNDLEHETIEVNENRKTKNSIAMEIDGRRTQI